MTPDNRDDSLKFGLKPSIIGFLIALAIFATMFGLADGFA